MVTMNRRTFGRLGLAGLGVLAAPAVLRAQTGTILIGFHAPLSGAQEALGTYALNGFLSAVDEINARGGILNKPIEVVVRDDKSRPSDSAAVIREFLGNGIQLVVGAGLAQPTLSAQGVVAERDVVYMAVIASNYAITHESFNDRTFRLFPSAWPVYQAEAQIFARVAPDVTRWGGIFPDLDTGRSASNAFYSGLRRHYREIAGKEIELVDPIYARFGATDYRVQLAGLMRSGITGMFSGMAGADMVTMANQARSMGLLSQVEAFADNGLEVFAARALGRNLPGNFWSPSGWDNVMSEGNEVSTRWAEAYLARTGHLVPTGFGVKPAAGLYVLEQAAIATGGTDPAELRQAIVSEDFLTPLGKTTFRPEDHQGICPLLFSKFEPDEGDDGWRRTEQELVSYDDVLDMTEPPSPGERFEG